MSTRTTRGDFEIVASYTFLYEADLARALLEANGIEARLLDDLQLQQRWYLAQALGGVKVAVLATDAYRARELLAEDHSAELDEEPESQLPAAPSERCPRCGAGADRESRQLLRPRLRDVLLAIGMNAPIRRTLTRRVCAQCGNDWSQVED
jgi:hypothetical protein